VTFGQEACSISSPPDKKIQAGSNTRCHCTEVHWFLWMADPTLQVEVWMGRSGEKVGKGSLGREKR